VLNTDNAFLHPGVDAPVFLKWVLNVFQNVKKFWQKMSHILVNVICACEVVSQKNVIICVVYVKKTKFGAKK
jgi:hypothetical protein